LALLSAFALGLAGGVALMRTDVAPPPSPVATSVEADAAQGAPPPGASTPPPAPTVAAGRAGPPDADAVTTAPTVPSIVALELTVAPPDGPPRRVDGIALATHGMVLTTLSALDGARAVRTTETPAALVVGDVLAWDPEHDLAALALHGLPAPAGRLAIDDSASLYLGLSGVLQTTRGPVGASVDAPLALLPDHTYGYRLHLDATTPAGLAALTDAQGEALLGVARVSGGAHALAWGTEVVAALLDEARRAAPMPLTALTQDFFAGSDAGRWLRFRGAVASGDAEASVALGMAVYAAFPRRQTAIAKAVDDALARLVDRALRDGRADTALELIDAVDAALPSSRARDERYAAFLLGRARPREALERVAPWLAAAPADETLRALERTALAALVAMPAAHAELLPLLERAIARDPRHAPYYVARGDLRFAGGDYAAAHADYAQALALEPALQPAHGDALDARLERAALRRDTPGLVVVPLARHGGTLSARVAVNGRPREFIVDTGASVTAVSARIAAELGIGTGGEEILVRTANGVTRARRTRIDSLALGTAQLRGVPALVVDGLDGYAGLLGLDVLARFDVDLDAARGELRLRPR
ncbi:MAG: TIGR02281 family clan AA aspartic protease, partial [Gammaproteobacteria bacterium]